MVFTLSLLWFAYAAPKGSSRGSTGFRPCVLNLELAVPTSSGSKAPTTILPLEPRTNLEFSLMLRVMPLAVPDLRPELLLRWLSSALRSSSSFSFSSFSCRRFLRQNQTITPTIAPTMAITAIAIPAAAPELSPSLFLLDSIVVFEFALAGPVGMTVTVLTWPVTVSRERKVVGVQVESSSELDVGGGVVADVGLAEV